MTDDAARQETIEEIRDLMRSLAPETGGLLMMQYDVEEPEGTLYFYEVLALDGVHSTCWEDQNEIPEDEEELLGEILDGDFETWDSMDMELLVEYRDFLRTEPEEE